MPKKKLDKLSPSEIVDVVMGLISDNPSKISDKSGVSKSMVYRMKKGTVDPTTGMIELIMKAYNITWHKVLWRITNPKGEIK